MPYITREDGERFIIPTYRDVISAKKKSLLKREILLLSTNYGEYITLHRKNVDQYEVAFSPDSGYLLGETVWHYFKRPIDLIYCEAIPNTNEAILVVVKSGSVYLDGSFPIDNIVEELIIFRTQQNNFDIHIYGDVPISKAPEEGKISFDPASVRVFDVLSEPVFNKLPKVKSFQLQLVDTVLRQQGIGVIPIKQVLMVIIAIGLGWMLWLYISLHRKELPTAFVSVVNPYQIYLDTLSSPDPSQQIRRLTDATKLLYTMPGWVPVNLTLAKGNIDVSVKSVGTKTLLLLKWAKQNNISVNVMPDGFHLAWMINTPNRYPPQTIIKVSEVVGALADRLFTVMPGNHLQVAPIIDRKSYMETTVTISFSNIPPNILDLVGLQLQNLPLVLNKATMTFERGNISGAIVLQVLGY